MNGIQDTLKCPPLSEIESADKGRKWLLALGIFSIVLGAIALAIPVLTTVAWMLFLGALLFVNGIVQIYHTIRTHHENRFFLQLLISILYIVVGALMILSPGAGAISLSLLIASFFMVGGIFRIIWAVQRRSGNWGWVILNGIVTFFLGLIILANWPWSGLWVIGLFVGIEMIIHGWSIVMSSTAAREELKDLRSRCVATASPTQSPV